MVQVWTTPLPALYVAIFCSLTSAIDGNKRTAGMVMFTFLALNGYELTATEADYYTVMMAVASSRMTKEQLVDWLQTVVK